MSHQHHGFAKVVQFFGELTHIVAWIEPILHMDTTGRLKFFCKDLGGLLCSQFAAVPNFADT